MRPIFIGGCPRSGTTLLGALLGAHTQCTCVPEMPFKFDIWTRLPWTERNVQSGELREIIRGTSKFRQWGIEPPGESPAESKKSGSYRTAIEDMVQRYIIRWGTHDVEVWADHTPSNIRQVPLLLQQFPEAKFLHIVRDGRAVASSLLALGWGPNTTPDTARFWVEALGHGLAAEMKYPNQVRRIFFEELVTEPVQSMRQICEFVDLPPERRLGEHTEFAVPEGTLRQHRLVSKRPNTSRINAWRDSLTPRQVEIFEDVSGNVLELLGYAREYQVARPADWLERIGFGARRTVIEPHRFYTSVKNHLKHRLHARDPAAKDALRSLF